MSSRSARLPASKKEDRKKLLPITHDIQEEEEEEEEEKEKEEAESFGIQTAAMRTVDERKNLMEAAV